MRINDRRRLAPRVLDELSRQPEVSKQVRAKAFEIARDARKLAPRATGTLARGIGVERDRSGRMFAYLVGWTPAAFYGWLVESGTENQQPRPHLVPAAIRHGARPPRGGAGA